ncbi:MAG: hypothetical protein KJZ86_05520 [Caldilineaceae bacterium]|nr:hypothetical protein [Caldilineaceae bacterium]HRJ44922.1 hypothetical protein [Caldilineaceae bacterium]
MDALLAIGIGLLIVIGFGYLLVQMIRLRLEVWANQRIIAALEQAGHKPPAKKSRLPELLTVAILLLLFSQLLLVLFNGFW